MKKVSIITFSTAKNFGAALQSYGTYKALQNLNVEVEHLNYSPQYLVSEYALFSAKSLKKLLKSIIFFTINFSKTLKFNRFTNLMKFTTKHTSNKSITLDSDYIVLGSDQIWNSSITRGYDPVFWGNIPNKKRGKLISYAASFGDSNLNEEEKAILINEVPKIDCLSVREEDAQKIIFETTGIFPKLTLDPSFLLEKEDWLNLIEEKPKRKGDFLLLYSLCQYPETIKIAKIIAKEKKLKLIEIHASTPHYANLPRHKVIYGLGPLEFLRFFRDASFVVTDSFHGTTFSIIMEKNFYSIPHKEKGERMRTLINLAKLKNRLITSEKEINIDENIDYSITRDEVLIQRNKSLDFLKRAIDYDEKGKKNKSH